MLKNLRGYFLLCGQLSYWLFLAPFQGRFYRLGHTFGQIVRIGVQAVPMAALTALTIGVVLAMQSASQLVKLGAAVFVPGLVAASLLKELGPMLIAVIVIGRSGSAVTAELGTMRVSEEVDALEIMGIHPMSYLIVPRFLAMTIMMPVLTVFGIYVGLFGGWLVCSSALGMGTAYYTTKALEAIALRDVYICLLKSLVFGILVITIACHTGFSVRGGAEEVGKATTQSVVVSLLAVFVANAVITSLFFFE